MDICNLLKCINNLNEYISVTQDIINKYSNCNILFNMSTVLSLKKIRSFEIEYFNKCDENGAAFIVFERILRMPASKTWSLLGVELISLVQYWLEALRKHLIFHNNHWSNFLNTLLSFIEKIRLKSASIKNILVQETAECLLDLATNDRPDLTQRYQIIHCFNLCSADCSREIRTSMREKFGSYFTRLAALMSSCGDVATQYAVLEALLRWLLPRHDAAERARAAADWFPPRLYSARCVDIFLERRWHHFFQDARDFLNAHNSESGLVVSAACERFTIGSVVLVSETDDKKYWVDINTCGQSMSLMLEPKLLEVLNGSSSSCDVLVVHESNVGKIYLQREGTKLNISATTLDPQLLFPSNVLDSGDLAIVLDSADLGKVDAALRTAFQDKYMVLTNVDSSDSKEKKPRYFDSITKDQVMSGSRPDAKKKKHSGFIVKPRLPVSLQSPSTASTSSLAMLRDKLTGFSGFIYDKEPVSVCAVPQLSIVTEVSEPEEKRSLDSLSTLKLRSCGVLSMRKINTESEKIPSDSSQEARVKRKGISPVLEEEETNVSCLLVATIGSTDDSIINDTISRLPKDKDVHTDNIVELLAKEALQYRKANADTKTVNEIKTDFNNCLMKMSKDPNTNKVKQSYLYKKQTVISNTTTDDSNLDVVENTPVYDVKKTKKVVEEKFTDKRSQENLEVDNQIIEQFFSQHINENSNREILISPTLARKINKSSSDSSELELMPDIVDNNFNINDMEIIEWLNEMVDTVCKDLEKCSKYLSQDVIELDKLNDEGRSSKRLYFNDITNVNEVSEKRNEDKIEPTPTKGIRLKFNTKNSKDKSRLRNKKKIDLEPAVEIAQIESKKLITSENVYANENPVTQSVESETFKTPDIRRKRKLYSPKDDISNERDADINESENNQSIPVKSKPDLIKNNKTLITPYKDIENMRKKANTNVRNKTRKNELLLSPRSKNRNEMFDNLKNTIEGEKNITLVERNTRNKHAIYNFTSDSEDEDFKDKQVATKSSKKKTNNTTTRKSTGRRKLNRPKNDDVKSQKVINIKPNTRSRKKIVKKNNENLERPQLSFERMRGHPPECLELSFVAEGHSEICDNDPKPIAAVALEMEIENNDEFKENKEKLSKQRKKRKINKEDDTVKSTGNINKLILIDDKPEDKDVTVSPLPGLVIEAVPPRNDSMSICTLEGFKDISGEKHFSLLNNTQNLLCDVDLVDCPPRYNVSDQISVATSNESKIRKSKRNLSTRKRTKTQKIKKEVDTKIHKSPRKETINLNSSSEKSIITAGKSPITAHGDFDEAPPSFQQLNQRIVEPRGLDVSNLSNNMKDYFKILNKEINISPDRSYSSSTEQEPKTSKTKPKEIKTVSNLSPVVSIARLSLEDIGRWIPPRFNSVFGSDQSSNESVARERTPSIKRAIAKHKENSINVELKVDKEINMTESQRKSLISPIKLFDNIIVRKEVSNSHSSYKLNEVFNNNLLRNNSDLSSSRYDLKSNIRTHMATSSHTKGSPSVDRNEKNLKVGSEKRQYMEEYEYPKKKKVFNKVQRNIELESAPSASSVDAWVSRNIAEKNTPRIYAANENYTIPEIGSVTSEDSKIQRKPSRGKQLAESVDPSLKDNIETVLEMVDTTLLEIHHNTSKKLVNMNLRILKSLNDAKEQRRQMYKDGVRELLSNMIKQIDDKFTDLDRRSQEMDDQFISELKEQTREVLRNDCKQKRVMITLLREDIQAVRDHLARTDRCQSDAE